MNQPLSDYISSYDHEAPTPEVGDVGTWMVRKSRKTPWTPAAIVSPLVGWDEPVKVIEVRWNGEEWWVKTSGPRDGEAWTDLSVFWEHFVPNTPSSRR